MEDEITQKILAILKKYTEKEDISLDDNIYTDLGLSSLSLAEVIVDAEEQLGTIIYTDEISRIRKVKHLINQFKNK